MENIKEKPTEKLGIAAILCAAYFGLMPFSIVPLPIGVSLLKLMSYAIGGYFILALLFGWVKIKLNFAHLVMSAYILYTIASIYFLSDENALINIRGMLEIYMVYILLTTAVYNKKEQNFILYAWIAVGVISAIMGCFAQQGEGEGRTTLIVFGGREDPNQFCGYFLLPIGLFLQGLMDRKTKKPMKIFYGVVIIASMYAVLSTGSRGGLIAVVIAGVTYVFIATKGIKNKLKMLFIVLIAALVSVYIILPIMPEGVRSRFSVEAVKEDKGSGRFEIWEQILKSITQNDRTMILGQGIGSTVHILADCGIENSVAHNQLLQVWCDQGLVGVILFIMIMTEGMRRCYRDNRVITVALIGMFALAMSLTVYASFKAFWNIIMMSAINFAPQAELSERIEEKNES